MDWKYLVIAGLKHIEALRVTVRNDIYRNILKNITLNKLYDYHAYCDCFVKRPVSVTLVQHNDMDTSPKVGQKNESDCHFNLSLWLGKRGREVSVSYFYDN